jgi:very-short-patch-repair endonuclease
MEGDLTESAARGEDCTEATRPVGTALERAVSRWADQLVDLSARNPLLRLRDTKTTTLDLTGADDGALSRMLAGRAVRLAELFPVAEDYDDAQRRAWNLRRRERSLREEQGVATLHLAAGVLNWNEDPQPGVAARRMRAPLLLQPVELSIRAAAEDPTVVLAGVPVMNPALAFLLRKQHGLDLAWEESLLEPEGASATILGRAHGLAERVRESAPRLLTLHYEERLVLGLFSYEKLPMVEDLRGAAAVLAAHDIVMALSGDERARDVLLDGSRDLPSSDPDRRPPRHDHLVLDADSSQEQAIDAVLADRHLVIKGPPGTGKSQTIANLIASLSARGKRVLFVAEKRVAIEAVVSRLADAGLEDLVLQLPGGTQQSKHVAGQLARTLDSAGRVPPVDGDALDRTLARERATLVEHDRQLHQERTPWGISIYEAQSELLGLDGYESTVRFPSQTLRTLDANRVQSAEDRLRELVDAGAFLPSTRSSPWAEANIERSEQVRELIDHLAGLEEALPDALEHLRQVVESAGLRPPLDLDEWERLLGLLDALAQLLAVHEVRVLELPEAYVNELIASTASSAWRRQQETVPSVWARHRLRREARALRRDGERNRVALHQGLVRICELREQWRVLAESERTPQLPDDLPAALERWRELRVRLSAISAALATGYFERLPMEAVNERVRRLRADVNTLQRLPTINTLTKELERVGLARLLDELRRRRAGADEALAIFRSAWLHSVLDHTTTGSGLATFNGAALDRSVREFAEADRRHQRLAAQRVRRVAAERLVASLNRYPAQGQLVKAEAVKKKGHRSLRRLVAEAGDVVLAARPCWAMSPLIVSQVLPPACLFDVVIFDEASQVRPHEAVTSIMRGRRLVLAGDERQLPPTTFFERVLADEDEDGITATDDYESILDILQTLLPVATLNWHYRSEDERLIAFSNVEIYDSRLVTFPGTSAIPSLRHVLVKNAVAAIGQDGSAVAEVDAVVELAIEHAKRRPSESLGVIAFSDKHAQRIERKLRAALANREDVQEFFSEQAKDSTRPFFVKNLETVQGDERDAIILSVGLGKTAGGALSHNFGPINKRGGERRLNVAVTRARRRLTVVSAFSSHDLDPRKLTSRGPQLLGSYLRYVESGGQQLHRGPHAAADLNPFEQSVRDALEQAGVQVTPQYGVSGYRLDFAASHPEQPGRMVLAIETDGANYHSSRSARDRDRLRQQHLEQLGWRFHRIWSTDWFRDPAGEVDKVLAAWKEAVEAADEGNARPLAPSRLQWVDEGLTPAAERRLPRPHLPRGLPITSYTTSQLDALVLHIRSDGLLRDNGSLRRAAAEELGFQRQGTRIRAALDAAIERTRRAKGSS